jgi:hypothetical protein
MAFKMMKRILFILFLIVGTLDFSAQSNLEFSQVLYYSGNLVAYSMSTVESPVWTVPENKVWKIENRTLTGLNALQFIVNNVSQSNTFLFNTGLQAGAWAATSVINDSPFWLNAGGTIKFQLGVGNIGGSSIASDYFISVIEYTIIN